MHKKSQITLFIVIAIVIVMVFGFLLFIRSRVLESSTQGNVQEQIDVMLSNTPVKLYIESCLEKTTEDALVLVGKQGGRIYSNQLEGTTRLLENINSLEYQEDNIIYYVSYGIYKSKEIPPDYPYPGSLNPEDKTKAFGKPSFIALCDNQGQNKWNLPNAKYSCIQYDPVKSEHSVQEYLEKYIENKTKECVDFTTLTSDLGYEIREGDISIKVLLGDTDVLVTMDYELIILGDRNTTATKLMKYSINQKIRLKKIYELAYYMVQEETNNIFFDMTDSGTLTNLTKCPSSSRRKFNEPCLKQGMEVKQIKDVCQSCSGSRFSDIIQIKDSQSMIDNKPYVFQFAVKNRAPALDYIDRNVDYTLPYYLYLRETYGPDFIPINLYDKTNSPCTDCNIVVDEGEDIAIYPHGIDPDGDYVTYEYSGWNSNLWFNSDLYKNSLKNSMIKATDTGNHIVEVKVVDNEGLYDYQEVLIGVEPLP